MIREEYEDFLAANAASLYRSLREYDFFSHWSDDALMRQCEWAASCHLDRISYMRLMLFASGKWMVEHAMGITDLLSSVNGAPVVGADQYDLPF